MKSLLVVNGHPDPRAERFCAALSAAYREGAEAAGWQAKHLDIGACAFSTLEALKQGYGDDARTMLDLVAWADRLVIVYPLWFGQPPQGLRLLFSYLAQEKGVLPAGRKAHVIVTMDMPAFAYRGLLHPHDGQPLPLLDLPGLMIEDPVLIGSVSQLEADHRARWLSTMRDYGQNTTLGSTSAATQALSLKSRIERSAKRWWNAL